MIHYKTFNINLVDIHGLMLDFGSTAKVEEFLKFIGEEDAPIWHDGYTESSLVEFEEIQDSIPEDLAKMIEVSGS